MFEGFQGAVSYDPKMLRDARLPVVCTPELYKVIRDLEKLFWPDMKLYKFVTKTNAPLV